MKAGSLFSIIFTFVLILVITDSLVAQRNLVGNGPRTGMWRVSVESGGIGLGCDLTITSINYRYKPFGNIDVSYVVHPLINIGVYAGVGSMLARFEERKGGSDFFWSGLNTELRLPVAQGVLVPFIFFRFGGAMLQSNSTTADEEIQQSSSGAFIYGIGIGLEYIYMRQYAIRIQGGSLLSSSDKLDNIISGDRNDGISFLSVGVSYYFSLSKRVR